MSIRSKRQAFLVSLGLVALGLSAACGPVLPLLQSGGDPAVAPQSAAVPAGSTANPTPPAASPKVAAGRQLVPVQRGAVTETVTFDGIVAPQAQEAVTYAWRASVDDIKAKVGQTVKQGDVLIDFSSADAKKTLDLAQARLKSAQNSLAKAQTDAQSRQAAASDKAAADQHTQQQVILDAETALRRAQDNLTTVKAGRSATERQVANTAVTYYGSTNLASAQDALDKLLSGPDPTAVQAAQRDVAGAQLVLSKARNDLAALVKGPDAGAVRDAELSVQKAQNLLQVAQSAKPDPKIADPALARQQHDLGVADAQSALDKAQAQLAQLKQPPTDLDVQGAKFRVTDAENGVAAAQAKLDAVQAGPDQATIDAAQHQVEYAKHALSELQAVADEVNSHPQPFELAAAEDQVRKAQTALDNARKPVQVVETPTDLSDLKDAVIQGQTDVTTAEKALEASHLRAPFDGTVVAVRAKVGEFATPNSPLIMLARPGAPIVTLDLDDTTVGQLSAGQKASLQIGSNAGTAQTVNATVKVVTPTSPDGKVSASATLSVDWADGQVPSFGTQVAAVVALQQKQDVLVVPKSAVKGSGTHTTVEIQDGSLRHLVTVKVGIVTTDKAEIVAGLTEGQMVLAASS